MSQAMASAIGCVSRGLHFHRTRETCQNPGGERDVSNRSRSRRRPARAHAAPPRRSVVRQAESGAPAVVHDRRVVAGVLLALAAVLVLQRLYTYDEPAVLPQRRRPRRTAARDTLTAAFLGRCRQFSVRLLDEHAQATIAAALSSARLASDHNHLVAGIHGRRRQVVGDIMPLLGQSPSIPGASALPPALNLRVHGANAPRRNAVSSSFRARTTRGELGSASSISRPSSSSATAG